MRFSVWPLGSAPPRETRQKASCGDARSLAARSQLITRNRAHKSQSQWLPSASFEEHLRRSYPQSNPQSGHREGNGRANLDFEVAAGLEYIWICNWVRFPKEKPIVGSRRGRGDWRMSPPYAVMAAAEHNTAQSRQNGTPMPKRDPNPIGTLSEMGPDFQAKGGKPVPSTWL
jgi:hypothetical protein